MKWWMKQWDILRMYSNKAFITIACAFKKKNIYICRSLHWKQNSLSRLCLCCVYDPGHLSLFSEQNKTFLTVDDSGKSFVERVMVATVILQGSKHILFHNCYHCKKEKLFLKSKSIQILCQVPSFCFVFYVCGGAPGFVSQPWFLIFGESCSFFFFSFLIID